MLSPQKILSALLALTLVVASVSSAHAKPETLRIGQQAPSFTLKGVDGEMHSLSDYSDAEVLVIIFTCNHCPTAQAYEERIKALARDAKGTPVSVVAISPNDPKALRPDELRYSDLNDGYEDMKIRAKEHDFNFPYLYDGDDQSVSRKYGPVATPHMFVFDSERRLRYEGGIDNHENPAKRSETYARDVIEALLRGQGVPRKHSKVFGCSVKWSNKRKQARKSQKAFREESVSLKEGDLTTLKEFVNGPSDQIRMVNVWATWCGPCKEEFPDLVEIYQIYRSRDFQLRTVSLDGIKNKENALAFLKEHEASMVNYILPGTSREEFAKMLDPEWKGPLPHTVIIDRSGDIVYSKTGRFDPYEVKKTIVNRLGRTYFADPGR